MNICKNVNLFLKKLTMWTHNSCLPFYCTSKKKQILKGILVRKLLYLDQRRFQNPVKHQWWNQKLYLHCVKCFQIRSFFWSVFPRIRTEYGEIRSISPYSVRMRENTEQKKLQGSKCASDDGCCWILRKHFK